VLAAFAATALPFVLAEAATGVVSFATGLLSIPSLVGAGMAVNLATFDGGIAWLAYRARPQGVAVTGESPHSGVPVCPEDAMDLHAE